jgi:HEAT repeat protein
LERLLNEGAGGTEQEKQMRTGTPVLLGDSADKVDALFAAEDEFAKSAIILLEMLESETAFENYSDIADQSGKMAESLIMKSQDTVQVRGDYLTVAFQIVDVLAKHAGPESGKPLELQERAREAISNIGTEEVIDRAILSSLEAEHWLDWGALERFIGQMDEKAAIPSLVRNFLESNVSERRKLGEILISMGSIVVSELRRWLPEVERDVLIKDIMPILGEIGGTEVLNYFSDILNHSNPQVRRSAISALARDKNPGVMKLILNKARDEDEKELIRQLAISVLARMGNEQVVEEMERIIKGKSATLKREAIHALGNIGGEKSISILSDLLRQRRLIVGRRRIERLQLYAVEALSRIGTESAVEVLLEMSEKKKGNVKSACDKALESL